jgi:hypothetical protein
MPCAQDEAAAHVHTADELAASKARVADLEATNAVLRSELESSHAAAAADRVTSASAADAAAAAHSAVVSRLEVDLEAAIARAVAAEGRNADLSGEVEAKARGMAALRSQQETALVRVGKSRLQERSAVVIQRSWRRWQRREAAAAYTRDVQGWNREKEALGRKQHEVAAQTGRALAVATVAQIEGTINTLLMEMLLSGPVKRKLKAAQAAAGVYGGGIAPPSSNGTVQLTPRGPGIGR